MMRMIMMVSKLGDRIFTRDLSNFLVTVFFVHPLTYVYHESIDKSVSIQGYQKAIIQSAPRHQLSVELWGPYKWPKINGKLGI